MLRCNGPVEQGYWGREFAVVIGIKCLAGRNTGSNGCNVGCGCVPGSTAESKAARNLPFVKYKSGILGSKSQYWKPRAENGASALSSGLVCVRAQQLANTAQGIQALGLWCGHECSRCRMQSNMNVIVGGAWMFSLSHALQHERYYGWGMDTLGTACSRT